MKLRYAALLLPICLLFRANAPQTACPPSPRKVTVTKLADLERIHREVRRRTLNLSPKSDPLYAHLGLSSLIAAEIEFGPRFYGKDNRTDVFPANKTPELGRNRRATVAMLPFDAFKEDGDGFYLKKPMTLLQKEKVCPKERFAGQISAALCTAFLVGPNLVATAGHCAPRKYGDMGELSIGRYKFVLDFYLGPDYKLPVRFSKDQVREADFIIARSKDTPGDKYSEDWLIVHLDGPPIEREIPPRRLSGQIKLRDDVYMIGSPLGLPLKYAPGAKVRSNDADRYFVANIDGFTSSSGSPVFNARDHTVEGIYVRGEIDLIDQCGCRIAVRCTNNGCRGEDVTRITKLSFNGLGRVIQLASRSAELRPSIRKRAETTPR